MKKSTLSSFLLAILIVCTSQKYKEAVTGSSNIIDHSSKVMSANSILFACPVHNGVIGKYNAKCTKCNMPLNVLAQETSEIIKKNRIIFSDY